MDQPGGLSDSRRGASAATPPDLAPKRIAPRQGCRNLPTRYRGKGCLPAFAQPRFGPPHRPGPCSRGSPDHALSIYSCLSSLHLLSSFRSSECRPQLGGGRPFPRSESAIERIRILVAEQECHFLDIHLRPVQVLVRQFLPRRKQQLPESCAVIDDSPLQGPIAQPQFARHSRYLRPAVCALCPQRQPRPAPNQVDCRVWPSRHGQARTRHHHHDAGRGLTAPHPITRLDCRNSVGFAVLGILRPSPSPAARGRCPLDARSPLALASTLSRPFRMGGKENDWVMPECSDRFSLNQSASPARQQSTVVTDQVLPVWKC